MIYELLEIEVGKFVKGEKSYMDEGTLKLQIEFFKTANAITQVERDTLIGMFPVITEAPVIE